MATNELAVGVFGRNVRSARRWRLAGSVMRHAVLLLFVALALFPVYFMIVSALKTNQDFAGNQLGPPRHPTFGTFNSALAGGDIFRWVLNSAIFTSVSVVISTGLAAGCAYPLSLMRWRPGKWLLTVLIALMVIPPIVLIIPLFQMMVDIHQLNTYQSVIVIYTGLMLPFSTFLLVSFFGTIPRSLLEAARIDGAKSWSTFVRIVLPLSLPAIVTVIVVQALWVWNEVLIAVVFLQSDSLRTLMVGLTLFKSRYQVDVPIVMAGMIVATIPMFLLYLVGQRFFVRGITAGGVKG